MARTKKDLVTEFRTAEILQAADRVFAGRGFERATMAAVAEAAGLAKGTLYLYYRSKHHLYCAALRRHLVDLRAETGEILDGDEPFDRVLQAFMSALLTYFDRHREFFRIDLAEVSRPRARRAGADAQIDRMHVEHVRALADALQRAVGRGSVRPVPAEAVAFAMFDLARGVAARRDRGWSQGTLEDDIAFAVETAWKGIGLR